MKRLIGTLYFLILSLSLTSCGEDPFKAKTASPSSAKASSTATTNSSTQSDEGCMCPMNYEPVCASGKTYSNLCAAQCEGKVFEYAGACN